MDISYYINVCLMLRLCNCNIMVYCSFFIKRKIRYYLFYFSFFKFCESNVFIKIICIRFV